MNAPLPSISALGQNQTYLKLHDRLAKTLHHLLRTLEDIVRNTSMWNETVDAYLTLGDKAIVEAGLFILLAARSPLEESEKRLVSNSADLLALLIRTPRNHALLMRFPVTAAAFAIPHVALRELNRGDATFESLLYQAFTIGMVDSVERLPYRAMDVRWIQALLFLEPSPIFDDLLPGSILTQRQVHPIYMSSADVYALTHSLMYLTDFGRQPLPDALDTDLIARRVDACIAQSLLNENLDLLGELLICASILGKSWSPYARAAWASLESAWDELGFLPSPSFDSIHFAALPDSGRGTYAYQHIYHTMFVAGILCVLLLRHQATEQVKGEWQSSTAVSVHLPHLCSDAVARAQTFCAFHRHSSRSEESERGEQISIDRVVPTTVPLLSEANTESSSIWKLLERIVTYPGFNAPRDTAWWQALTKSDLSVDEWSLVLGDGLLIRSCADYQLLPLAETLLEAAVANNRLTITFEQALMFLLQQQLGSGAIGIDFISSQPYDPQTAVTVTTALARSIALIGQALSC